MGPGNYDIERGDAVTRVRTTHITMGTSPTRRSINRDENTGVGPGQYDDGKGFGMDTKTFTIGEKRVEKTIETMGPGAYSPERADDLTKTKMVNIHMGTETRAANFASKTASSNLGPGAYDEGKKFG